MKVLSDRNVPRRLKKYLSPHEVTTAAEMGWKELKNGQLLREGEDNDFQVFITCDQDIVYHQISARKIAIVELTKNNWPSIQPNITEIVSAIVEAKPGIYRTIVCTYIYKPRKSKL